MNAKWGEWVVRKNITDLVGKRPKGGDHKAKNGGKPAWWATSKEKENKSEIETKPKPGRKRKRVRRRAGESMKIRLANEALVKANAPNGEMETLKKAFMALGSALPNVSEIRVDFTTGIIHVARTTTETITMGD